MPNRGHRVAGRTFSEKELLDVAMLVAEGVEAGLSRYRLALLVCARLDWHRPTGAPKARECRDLLEEMEGLGRLTLPAKRGGRPPGSRTRTPNTAAGAPGDALSGSVGQLEPLTLEPVVGAPGHRLFRELVGRYHYLGHSVPFGAHMRYLVFASRPRRAVVAALQISSPAWRLAARDQWIGWDDKTRTRNLQQVVNNTRFLVLPWVRVRNLASRVLSLMARQLPGEWQARYGVAALLVETLVDAARYRGSCYLAANWLDVGQTAGRGRMDRDHSRHGEAPKRVLVYPLAADAARRLREGKG